MDVSRARGRLDSSLKRVQALPDEYSKPILDFYRRCMRDGLSGLRIRSYLDTLCVLSEMLGKPLDKASETDVERLVYDVNNTTRYSEATKALYRITLKKMYGYSWIKTGVKRHQKHLPELVTEDDALKIISACDGLRDKALLATLYDLGCRPAELLRLTVGKVSFDEWGVVVSVTGKTGPRVIRGILCSPFLRAYMDSHPFRAKPDAPLWPVKKPGGLRKEYLMTGGLQTVLRKAARAAGFDKRVYPYMFRHSRATHNAAFMTESQLCAYHGWLHGSRMPSIYVHMSGKDVDDTLLDHYGLVKKEKREDEKPQRCPRCTEINAPRTIYCYKCGMPLSREAVLGMQEAVEKTDKLLAELMKDDEVRQLLMRKIGQMDVK